MGRTASRAVCLPIWVIASMGTCPFACAGTVTIASFPKDDPVLAIISPVVVEAYRRIGHDVVIEYMPGERAIVSANNGTFMADMYRVQGIEAKYPNLIKVPVPLYRVRFVAFTKQEPFQVDGWSSLAGKRVGYYRGIKAIEMNVGGLSTDVAATQTLLYQKLLWGRVDVVVDERVTGRYTIEKMGLTGVHELKPDLDSMLTYHYVNKSHADLVPKLTAVLKDMAEHHEIERITTREAARLGVEN